MLDPFGGHTNLGIVVCFVGVVLKRQPPVRLFDGVGACIARNTKYCVVVAERLHRMSEQVDREVSRSRYPVKRYTDTEVSL